MPYRCLGDMGGLAGSISFDAADRLGGGGRTVLVSSPSRSMVMTSAPMWTVTTCPAWMRQLRLPSTITLVEAVRATCWGVPSNLRLLVWCGALRHPNWRANAVRCREHNH